MIVFKYYGFSDMYSYYNVRLDTDVFNDVYILNNSLLKKENIDFIQRFRKQNISDEKIYLMLSLLNQSIYDKNKKNRTKYYNKLLEGLDFLINDYKEKPGLELNKLIESLDNAVKKSSENHYNIIH